MNFNISSSKLLKQLQMLSGVLSSSVTLPILDNFLFEINENALTITASDLETTMKTSIEAQTDGTGTVAIPAKLLVDTLKAFSEQPLTFIVGDDHNVEISSENGKFKLHGFDGSEYPKTPELENTSTVSIASETLARAINKTLFAASADDLRPTMSGVFFDFKEDGLTFVATDAHKLVRYQRTDIVAEGQSSFITPKKPLQLLKNILGSSQSDVSILYNEVNAQFKFDDVLLVSRLIDGNFPNYQAIIPKENPNKLTINRAELYNSIKRVSIYASKTTHQVRLDIAGNELSVSAEDKDSYNAAKETLSCSYEGTDMSIGFNCRFIMDLLQSIESEEVIVEMSAPSRAGILFPAEKLFDEENILMLVMPVMLQD
jgi:DNA polymerase-3 subunit beta